MGIEVILAVSKNLCIGKDGGLPWSLKKDMAYFKETTLGSTVVFGRRTFESIPGILKDRTVYVLTSQKDYVSDKCHLVMDDLDVIRTYGNQDMVRVAIAGGATLYDWFFSSEEHMGLVSKVHITEVDLEIEGDTYISSLPDFSDWDSEVILEEPKTDESPAFKITCFTKKAIKDSE